MDPRDLSSALEQLKEPDKHQLSPNALTATLPMRRPGTGSGIDFDSDEEDYIRVPGRAHNPEHTERPVRTRVRTYTPVVLSVVVPQVQPFPRPMSRVLHPTRPEPRRLGDWTLPDPVPLLPEEHRGVSNEKQGSSVILSSSEDTGKKDGLEQRPKQNMFKTFVGMYGRKPEEEDPEVEEEEIVYPTGWKWFLLLLSGAVPYIVVVLDDTLVATIIPVLLSEFSSPADIGWYASAYFLPLTVLMPVFGKAYSLWKVKWLFFGSLVVLLLSSIICATATSSPMFIGGRAGAGAGAAGIINGAMRIIGLSSPRKQRTVLEAGGALVMGSCTVSGPILGGVIAEHFSWRIAFWANVPIAVIALLVVWFIFPRETPRTYAFSLPLAEKVKRLDPIGASLLITSLGCIITVLQLLAGAMSITESAKRLAITSGAAFGVFIIHEICIRPDLALIPRAILKYRAVWAPCVTLFFLFAGFINFVFFLSIFFQVAAGESPQQSAISLVPYVVAVSVAAMIVGIGVGYVRYYNPFFVVGAILFPVGSGLVYTLSANASGIERAIFQAVLGTGVGLLTLANVAPCHIQLDEKDQSVANGLTFLSSLTGATVSVPFSSSLFNSALMHDTTHLPNVPVTAVWAVISDPTRARQLVPPEYLGPVIDVMVNAIRKTFIIGIGCAVASSLFSFLVPWKPLIATMVTDSDSEDSDAEKEGAVRKRKAKGVSSDSEEAATLVASGPSGGEESDKEGPTRYQSPAPLLQRAPEPRPGMPKRIWSNKSDESV